MQIVKTQILEMQKKYDIETVHDFNKLYELGIIEESDSWGDVQKFDRLSYEQDLYDFIKRLI